MVVGNALGLPDPPLALALTLALALALTLALALALLLILTAVLSKSPDASASAAPKDERWSVQKAGAPSMDGNAPMPSATPPEKNHVESPGGARAAPGAQPRVADMRSAPAEHVPQAVAPEYE